MQKVNKNGTITEDLTWTLEYNGLNQLDRRYSGASWTGANGDTRIDYTYDTSGNLTQALKETKSGGAWSQAEKWDYTWNVRDQMTRAVKYTTGANNVGSVEYEYCLSCDGALSPSPPALSHQREREPRCSAGTGSAAGALQSGRRYEYDGLNLLRVDELYDSNSNGLTEDDAWRRLEVNTHGPGTLGALIGKRVYTHTNNDATPDATNDFTYTYDAVGNVIAVYNANSTNRGNELYYFSQDAFGNELSNDGNLPTWQRVNLLGGTQWATARTAGITEHQTGKWIDQFTGLYFFHARWLDAGVGRFMGRDVVRRNGGLIYTLAANNPIRFIDSTGRDFACPACEWDELLRNPPYKCCNLFALADQAAGIWEEGTGGESGDPWGFKSHCYVCCEMAKCSSADRDVAWGAQQACEFFFGGPDSDFDCLACQQGFQAADGGTTSCKDSCDFIGSWLGMLYEGLR